MLTIRLPFSGQPGTGKWNPKKRVTQKPQCRNKLNNTFNPINAIPSILNLKTTKVF